MAKSTAFDPNTLVQDQEALTRTSDAMTAGALKHQSVLHRQRLGAAQVRLARAIQNDAPSDQIAMLQNKVLSREARLVQAEAQFAAADIVSPSANSDTAQVLGQVTGDVGEAPFTAALLSPEGEILASAAVGGNQSFVLSQSGMIRDARLQISDATQTILFRDAKGFDVEPGRIISRVVALADPGKPAAPAPTVLTTPDVTGQTEEAACAILFRLGVREIDVSRQASAGPAGLVLAQEPKAGTVLDPAGGAKLTVSTTGDDPTPGPDPVVMPDIIGLTLDEAQATTARRKIKLAVTSQPDTAPKGQVIAQAPPAGEELSPPLQASAVISAGAPDTIEVPEVIGRTDSNASAILQSAGLTVIRQTVRESGEANVVIGQQPQGGAQVAPGSAVRIVVNLGLRETPREVIVPRLTGQALAEADVIARRSGFQTKRETVRRDGSAGIVVDQNPDAGSRVTLPATIEIMVNLGPLVERPVRRNFSKDLTTAMQRDPRLENLNLNARALAKVIAKLELDDKEAVQAAIALDNAALMEKAGLRNRTQARTLRSILSGAMARMQ